MIRAPARRRRACTRRLRQGARCALDRSASCRRCERARCRRARSTAPARPTPPRRYRRAAPCARRPRKVHEARFRRRVVTAELVPKLEHARRHRRPWRVRSPDASPDSDSRCSLSVTQPSGPKFVIRTRIGCAGFRHARNVERPCPHAREHLVAQRLLRGAVEQARARAGSRRDRRRGGSSPSAYLGIRFLFCSAACASRNRLSAIPMRRMRIGAPERLAPSGRYTT